MNPHLRYAQAIQGGSPGAASASSTRCTSSRWRGRSRRSRARRAFRPRSEEGPRVVRRVRGVDDDARVRDRRARHEEQPRHLLGAPGRRLRPRRGREDLVRFCRERFKTVLLPEQMAPDGSFPQETRRTKPFAYSLFNLEAMAGIAAAPLDSRGRPVALHAPRRPRGSRAAWRSWCRSCATGRAGPTRRTSCTTRSGRCARAACSSRGSRSDGRTTWSCGRRCRPTRTSRK